MPTLRLFAGLREAAGTSRVELEGDTVGEILSAASARFGDNFSAGVASARVWKNGEEASPEDSVMAGDEVALIPPVSGGAQAEAVSINLVGLFPLLVGVGLGLAVYFANSAVWAAAVVGAIALWLIDLVAAAADRGLRLPLAPLLVAAVAGAIIGHQFSIGGFGATVLAAIVVSMAYPVFAASHRGLPALASTALLCVIGGVAANSLVAAPVLYEKKVVLAFFIAMAGGSLVAAGLSTARRFVFLDPTVAGFVVSMAVFPVAAVMWKLNVVAFLLAGLTVALAMIGGRGIGSLVRSGRVTWTAPAPGWLSALDGPLFAAAIYIITLDWFG